MTIGTPWKVRVRGAFAAAALLATAAPFAQLTDSRLELQTVAAGLSLPTSIVFLGPDDFLVSQKNDGRVLRVIGGVVQPGEVLDVDVNFANEQGLLSMVRDPDFAHNRWIYLYYTESSTGADSNATDTQAGNRVYRFGWDGTALTQPQLVLDLPADTQFPGIVPGPHNGGAMTFGPDDHLYVLIGDLAQGNQEAWSGKTQNNAAGDGPDDSGVILRVDRVGRGPVDNPLHDPLFRGNPLNRYWAYGIRNSFGLAFDPEGGALWQSENGPTDFDEINRVFPGFNGGWIRVRGPLVLDAEGLGDLWMVSGAAYGDPEFVWTRPVAPTSLAFVASPKLGCDLHHDLIAGDTVCGQLYKFELAPDRQTLAFTAAELQDKIADNQPDACADQLGELLFASGLGVVTDLENGPDGRLYVVVLTAGSVMRIAPVPGSVPDADSDEVDDACDCDSADGTSFSVPATVRRLRVDGTGGTTLGWNPQRSTAGDGTVYRLISGSVSGLRSLGWPAACTLASGLTAAQASDPRSPASGQAFFYLVEASNGCGTGGFEPGAGREALSAAAPGPCQ